MSEISTKPLIQVRHISKQFIAGLEGRGIVDLSFDVAAGTIVGVVGESGAGKSTLFRIIYGLEDPDAGEVLFKGERVKGPTEQLIPGHLAMRLVTQHFDDLNQYAQVWDNVASRLSNTDLEYKIKETERILKDLKIMHLSKRRVVDLSGGERQRVAIARALVTRPEVLLMDEPFNQVDAYFRDALQQDLREIVAKTGVSICFISHDPSESLGLAEHIIVLKEGKLMQEGQPQEVYQHPKQAYVAHLLARSNIVEGAALALINQTAQTKPVAIHPEWIKLQVNNEGSFIICNVLYKGFYTEVWVRHIKSAVQLRTYTYGGQHWKLKMRVDLFVHHYVQIEP